ncbi:MAG: hypothetical protein AAGA68_05480 [Pseudomonadota bacterium]
MKHCARLIGILLALALSAPSFAQTIILHFADGSEATRAPALADIDLADLPASAHTLSGADLVLDTQVLMRDGQTLEEIVSAPPGAEVNFATRFNRLDSLEVPFDDLVGRVFVTAVIAPTLGVQVVIPIVIEADDGAIVGISVNASIPAEASPGPFPLIGLNRVVGFTSAEDTAVLVRFVDEAMSPELVQVGDVIAGAISQDQDGRVVDISDDGLRVVLGTSLGDAGRVNGGQVRVFEWNGSAWGQLGQTLVNPDPAQRPWGEVEAVSISGDGQRLAIGNALTLQSDGRRGSIWVYEWIEDQWVQIGATITTPFDPGNTGINGYGVAVALSTDGSRLAAGAWLSSATPNGVEGAFTVFQFEGGGWTELGASVFGTQPGEDFGASVDISGDGARVIVGAPAYDELTEENVSITRGRALVYDWDGVNWVAVGGPILGRFDGPSDIRLGQSVNIAQDGSRVATFGNFSGDRVRVFENFAGDWTQLGEFFEVIAAFDLHQPMALSSDGNRIAIGGPFATGNNNGRLAIFDWDGNVWMPYAPQVEGEVIGDQLGWSVAMTPDGQRAIAGMPGWDDGNPGAIVGGARVYDIR